VLLMRRPTLPLTVVEALQAAGATEEMISVARVAFVAYEGGYRAKTAARQRPYVSAGVVTLRLVMLARFRAPT
jgi:hypothetical protein